MNKRSLGIILGVFLLVAAVFLAKGISQGESQEYIPDSNASTNVNTDENTGQSVSSNSLHERYESIKSSNKPSIIVFSYKGDCCPSTKQFFDSYNTEIKDLFKDYEGKFETMFIDIDGMSREEGEFVGGIAEENGVKRPNIPFLVIRDNDGNPQRVVEGPFDNEEIRSFMDGVL